MKVKTRYESRRMVLNRELGKLQIGLKIIETFYGSSKLNFNELLTMHHNQN